MTKEEFEITEIVNRETKAWDNQDVELLISIFHHEMVWPWPENAKSHDPMEWEMVMGKFDWARWKKTWQDLFDNYKLVHNYREIKKIVISEEKDGSWHGSCRSIILFSIEPASKSYFNSFTNTFVLG